MSDVLLVEPDTVLAKAIRQALSSAGHQVRWVTTAQTGISAADERQPDLVVLELQLVEHSGIEFLYELRSYADWQAVPAIIYTMVPMGEFHGSLELLGGELGVSQYLYKPQASLQDLLSAVNQSAKIEA